MTFACTPDSAARGEITILAILETFMAVAFSLLLVKLFDTTAHIVIGAIVVPFLLLRTEASTMAAFTMFDAWFPTLAKVLEVTHRFQQRLPAVLRSLTFFFIGLPVLLFLSVVMKVLATVLTLISSPRESLLAIPGNWLRLNLATDLRHAPELLPGIETAADDAPATLQTIRYTALPGLINAATAAPFFQKLALFIIRGSAVSYRLILKSTSLVYFPLIWVSTVPLTVKGILTFPLERVRRWYACVVLVVMLSPLLIAFRAPHALPSHRDRTIFAYVLPVHQVDWWHISRVVAVSITIAIYFYSRKLAQDSVQPDQDRSMIVTAHRLRAGCALFTMACFLPIVLAS